MNIFKRIKKWWNHNFRTMASQNTHTKMLGEIQQQNLNPIFTNSLLSQDIQIPINTDNSQRWLAMQQAYNEQMQNIYQAQQQMGLQQIYFNSSYNTQLYPYEFNPLRYYVVPEKKYKVKKIKRNLPEWF